MASIKEQLTFAADKGLIPVLSKEGLAAGSPDRKRKQAQRFMEAFGDCKAILVVREPVSFIRSYYVQMIKQFNAGPPGRRPDWMRTLGKPPHYFDINEWMAAAWPSRTSPKKALAYADTAGIYADVFGRENIHVFIFEELVRNPEQFVSRLCTCLGIDGKEGFDLINGKRSNKRMSTGAIDRIKRIEKSFIQTLRFRCTGGEQRRRMLFPPDDSGEKIKPEISDKWLAEIHALGTEQNRRLAEEWGLPLADYGYRL